MTVQPIPPPAPASPNAISTALLVSSCTKLFPILLVIWANDSGDASGESGQGTAAAAVSEASVTSTLSLFAVPSSTPGVENTPSSGSFFSALLPQSWSGAFTGLQPMLSLLFSVTHTHLVLLNNIEALFILLDCGYVRAAAMAIGGQLARWVVERLILSVVGL
jgi:hypothetical protein